MTDDPFHLQRFVEAQEPCYATALAELQAGSKQTHWMWFIFPQIRGLGFSPMAMRYAIGSRAEAQAYLDHALLGPRLRQCVRAALVNADRSLHQIFGSPDDMKFRSSMTLFCLAGDGDVFREALDRYHRRRT